MIHALLHNRLAGFRADVQPAEIGDLVADDRNVLWLDVEDPSAEDLAMLHVEFGFHELALEDVTLPHQRPKLETYGTFAFLVFYAAWINDTGRLRLREVDLFVGPNYLVSLHHGPVPCLSHVAERWRSHGEPLAASVGGLLHAALDSLVDECFPVLDRMAERADEIEERVVRQPDQRTPRDIVALKKDLLGLRRVLAPQRDVLNQLLRGDLPVVDHGWF